MDHELAMNLVILTAFLVALMVMMSWMFFCIRRLDRHPPGWADTDQHIVVICRDVPVSLRMMQTPNGPYFRALNAYDQVILNKFSNANAKPLQPPRHPTQCL